MITLRENKYFLRSAGKQTNSGVDRVQYGFLHSPREFLGEKLE